MGNTPIILLNTLEPITLTPDFTGTRIVYSGKQFTDGTGWAFPAGKKQPLDYRYDFTEPFTKVRAGTMCSKKANLPALTGSISKAYKLTPDETSALSRELTSQFPTTCDLVKVTMANPADIASRIAWLGNGKPLSILQLFFELTPGACTTESLTPPTLDIPANRDGLEVGIIE